MDPPANSNVWTAQQKAPFAQVLRDGRDAVDYITRALAPAIADLGRLLAGGVDAVQRLISGLVAAAQQGQPDPRLRVGGAIPLGRGRAQQP